MRGSPAGYAWQRQPLPCVLTSASVSMAQNQRIAVLHPRRRLEWRYLPAPHTQSASGQNPDMLTPPVGFAARADLRSRLSDAHMRQTNGGWTPSGSHSVILAFRKRSSGVPMRLNAGSVRELHWHKQAEWAYMLYGSAAYTAHRRPGTKLCREVPRRRRSLVFSRRIPHSIGGPGGLPYGCASFCFDDGELLLGRHLPVERLVPTHGPPEVLVKTFGAPASCSEHTPDPASFILQAPVPPRCVKTAAWVSRPVPQTQPSA